MSDKLANKIALVTGGSSGIGLATAQRFVAEGTYVFITGRRQAELDAAVALIGENVHAIRGDVSKLPDLDNIYETIRARQHARAVVHGAEGAVADDGWGVDHLERLHGGEHGHTGVQRVQRIEGRGAQLRSQLVARSEVFLSLNLKMQRSRPARQRSRV